MVIHNADHKQTKNTDHRTGVLFTLSPFRSGPLKLHLLLVCLTLQYVLVHTHTMTTPYNYDDDDGLHQLQSKPAENCQFPHIVLLHIDGIVRLQCAGNLIDSRHAITAAHCLNHRPRKIVAYFGSVNTTQMPIKISVESYKMHKDYVRKRKYLLNDVAILKLSKAVNISDCIKPITMATSHQYYKGSCVVAGWGVKSYYGSLSTRLHYSSLPIVPLKHCKTISPFLRDQHVCAGELIPDGRTTCKGDSGSPLMCIDAHKNERVLVGIVSYGWKCKTGLSVYARVSFFHKWILKHIL